MRFHFNERKATQAAARFIELAHGAMNYTALIKLLYLADRTAFLQWRRPITGDSFVSMNKGPVLSRTYDLIKGGTISDYWSAHIAPRNGYRIELRARPDFGALSEQELSLIENIFNEYGRWTLGQLIELCHRLPEWQDPGRSAFPIEPEDILLKSGRSEEEVASIQRGLDARATLEMFAVR